MNKLKLSPVLAATVAVAAYTHPNQALAQGVVSYTNASPISISGPGTDLVSFSQDIPDADELLSISGGSLSGGEGASFTLSVEFTNSTTQQIYSGNWNIGDTYNLNTIPSESFATGDVAGLVFNVVNGSGGPPIQFSVPAGTVFTFGVSVPEPASGALLVLGAAGIWALARRRAG